jgi:threonine/homoserine/homoserine lactone efflux protein
MEVKNYMIGFAVMGLIVFICGAIAWGQSNETSETARTNARNTGVVNTFVGLVLLALAGYLFYKSKDQSFKLYYF